MDLSQGETKLGLAPCPGVFSPTSTSYPLCSRMSVYQGVMMEQLKMIAKHAESA